MEGTPRNHPRKDSKQKHGTLHGMNAQKAVERGIVKPGAAGGGGPVSASPDLPGPKMHQKAVRTLDHAENDHGYTPAPDPGLLGATATEGGGGGRTCAYGPGAAGESRPRRRAGEEETTQR